MGSWLVARYAAGTVAVGAAMLIVAPSAVAAGSGIDPRTRANALEAMHGEAFAGVAYQAYAAQAMRERLPRAAAAFRWAGRQELREHFTGEAGVIRFVGGDADNLRTAMAGETEEATHLYPRFAREAAEDGDLNAARLFSEIAQDEAAHGRDFAAALEAITDPSGHTGFPPGPTAQPHEIPAGGPQVSSSRTLRNLQAAMHGEAFASAAYTLYAEHALTHGRPRVARLFLRTALVERTEHFAEQAVLAGLVRDTRTDLRVAIAGETAEAREMYPRFAREARAAGDLAAARLFRHIGREEARHAGVFSRVLGGLRS